MSDRQDDALDEEALEASTVIERRTGAAQAGMVRLSPLQPLARVDTKALPSAPSAPDLRIVLPEPAAPPAGAPPLRLPDAPHDLPEPPPLQLLRPGTEPARALADPWPAGSARRGSAPRVQAVAGPAHGRRLVLVGLVGFAAGALVRDRWDPRGAPVPPAGSDPGAPPAARPAPPPAAIVPSPAPAAPPAPAPGRASSAQKRKRGRGF